MNDVRFTPGPWFATTWYGTVRGDVSGNEHSGEHAAVFSANDLLTMIAPLGPIADPESRANAALIAAAPELYEALDALTKQYVQLASSGDCGFWDCETEPQVIAARSALLRAQAKEADDAQ